jgi:hypothetical protein
MTGPDVLLVHVYLLCYVCIVAVHIYLILVVQIHPPHAPFEMHLSLSSAHDGGRCAMRAATLVLFCAGALASAQTTATGVPMVRATVLWPQRWTDVGLRCA